jgi:hypothetical protein
LSDEVHDLRADGAVLRGQLQDVVALKARLADRQALFEHAAVAQDTNRIFREGHPQPKTQIEYFENDRARKGLSIQGILDLRRRAKAPWRNRKNLPFQAARPPCPITFLFA